jgi:hypothetical protein
MTNNKQHTYEELISIADEIYQEQNPTGTMCTPNSVYITVLEKWYPKYVESKSELDFYDYCYKAYGVYE